MSNDRQLHRQKNRQKNHQKNHQKNRQKIVEKIRQKNSYAIGIHTIGTKVTQKLEY